MDCERCELYFWCGGKEECPFEVEEDKKLTIDILCEVTGADEATVNRLIMDGYYSDFYCDGVFDEHAIELTNNYIDGTYCD